MTDEEAVSFLLELLRIPSVTGMEQNAVAFLLESMAREGLDPEVDEVGNAIGSRLAGKGGLMFLGHADTAPGEVPVRLERGRVYGRGAVDAKGPLAAAVVAAGRARAPARLRVIGAVGEEGPSHGARHLLKTCPPEALIIGEPGGSDSVVLGYKGSMRAEISFVQPSAHSAGQEPTACDAAVKAWDRVKRACDGHSSGPGEFNRLSPALIEMGSDSDGIEQRAWMRSTFRLPPGLHLEEAREDIASAVSPGDVRFEDADPAFQASKNTSLVACFLRGLRAEELRPRFKYKTGTSDMNVVAPAWRCPAVAYGPGDSSLDHTPDEHIEVHEYLQGIRVLTRVFGEWR